MKMWDKLAVTYRMPAIQQGRMGFHCTRFTADLEELNRYLKHREEMLGLLGGKLTDLEIGTSTKTSELSVHPERRF